MLGSSHTSITHSYRWQATAWQVRWVSNAVNSRHWVVVTRSNGPYFPPISPKHQAGLPLTLKELYAKVKFNS